MTVKCPTADERYSVSVTAEMREETAVFGNELHFQVEFISKIKAMMVIIKNEFDLQLSCNKIKGAFR